MRSMLAGLAALGCAFTACARYQYVAVRSEPSGAEVFLDKQLVGRTPLDLRIDRDRTHAFYVKRGGYRPELVLLERVESPDGLAYLVPPDVEVRLAPGADSREQDRDLEIEAEPEPR
jgi:hypothetical protein